MAIPSPEPNGGSGQYTGVDQWGRPVTVTNYAPGVQDRTAWYNVWKFYQPGNDGPDHGPMFRRAVAAAKAAGGGVVYAPAGVYSLGGAVDGFGNLCAISLPAGVSLLGDGCEVTILRLANGANCDLVQGENAPALINVNDATAGDMSTGGVSSFTLSRLTLDGNKANQSGGTSYCFRLYGYTYRLDNVHVINGFSGGMLVDWNGGNTPAGAVGMEVQWRDLKVRGCNGIGIEFGGPHDSQWANVFTENSGSHGIKIGVHASGLLASNVHSWGSGLGVNAVAILIECVCQFVNSVAEGSDTVQLAILANDVSWIAGNVYGNTGRPASGIQFGQNAGGTPYNGSAFQSGGLATNVGIIRSVIDSQFSALTGANGALWFVRENGGGVVRANIGSNVTTVYTGTPNLGTQLTIMSQLSGANGPLMQLPGMLSLFRGGTQTPTNGSTINTQAVAVARVNPAAAVTGIILQAGLFDNQYVIVRNIAAAANSITFAAAGSNVADGSSDVIAGLAARAFVWDNQTNLWYKCV